MLKTDLADAGIPYVDDAGRYVDFHALRHSTGSLLAAIGAHPKVVQSIMRHSDINLTMSRYTHVLRGQESEAIATGTDNKAIEATQHSAKELTLKLTPTTYPVFNQLSQDGSVLTNNPQRLDNHKLPERKLLGKQCQSFSPPFIKKNEKPTVGFEPTTTGLQNQSSTIELRWRQLRQMQTTGRNLRRFHIQSTTARPILQED